MINYNGKRFKVVQNSSNGAVSDEMVFFYKQIQNVLTCEYSGKHIKFGHLLGTVDEDSNINMVYHQINQKGELRTGVCKSTPHILSDGRIRLNEQWKWTNGDGSSGDSVLEEVK